MSAGFKSDFVVIPGSLAHQLNEYFSKASSHSDTGLLGPGGRKLSPYPQGAGSVSEKRKCTGKFKAIF